MDPSAVPRELARVRGGTRIRLFYVEQGDRYAVSGALRSVRGGNVTIAPDDGGELTVAVSAVTCFYVPRPPAARTSVLAPLRAALGRAAPAGAPRPELPQHGPAPARSDPPADGDVPRAPEQEAVPALER